MSEASQPGQSHLISRVLSPAVKFWLRSQADQVENLEFHIEGGDRQLLSGHIPKVFISAQKAVYQGLHLSQIHFTGNDIRVNLGQILRGKPLRLLQPVPIAGELLMEQADLNTSFQAPLLANALADFLVQLLRSPFARGILPIDEQQPITIEKPQVLITSGLITLSANLSIPNSKSIPLVIRTGLQLANGHELRLDHPQWLSRLQATRGLPLEDLHGFQIDLGPEVNLQDLILTEGQIICRGTINVTPA